MLGKPEKGFHISAIVLDGDKVLLCRKQAKFGTYWVLPGGGLTLGESVTQCVAREVREETGYQIAIEKWLYIRHAHDVLSKSQFLDLMILGRVIGGTLDTEGSDEDIKEVKWVAIADVGGIDLRPAQLKDVLPSDFANAFSKNPRDLGFDEY